MGEWIGFSIMLLFSIGCYVLSGFFLHGNSIDFALVCDSADRNHSRSARMDVNRW